MELTDLQIKERITKGDAKVYEYIIDKYSKQMYYLAFNIMHISCSKEDMEECVSDAFLNAWVNINKFEAERGSFKTWLFILTKYKALEYKRRNSKEKIMNIEDLQIESAENIENCLIAQEKQKRVMEIINTFNTTDREIFLRRYYYNEKVSSLMDEKCLSRTAIDNRLLRCRNKIKEAFLYE